MMENPGDETVNQKETRQNCPAAISKNVSMYPFSLKRYNSVYCQEAVEKIWKPSRAPLL
jgi:hypothetical protein